MQDTPDALVQTNNILPEMDTLVSTALKVLMNHTTDLAFVKTADLVYAAASKAFVDTVGLQSTDEIIGMTDWDIFEDKNLAKRYVADDRKVLESGENMIDYIEPLVEKNGRTRYGCTSKYILSNAEGKVIGLLGITKDITRDYITRHHYQQEIKGLFSLQQSIYSAYYIDIDDWRIISHRHQLINGNTLPIYRSVEQLCKTAISSIAEGEEAIQFYTNISANVLRNFYTQGKNELSFACKRCFPDNSIRWVRNNIRFLIDANTSHLCIMISTQDIETEKQAEHNLTLSATLDKMTMLYNRETTMDNIRQTLEQDSDKSHALFILDIDNFKTLNDTQGHQAGDEFLVNLAATLRHCFRETDIIGRIGGDEFFILMKNIHNHTVVKNKAFALLSAIRDIGDCYQPLELSGSIGISLYPQNACTLDTLYTEADAALYRAKHAGKNCVMFA